MSDLGGAARIEVVRVRARDEKRVHRVDMAPQGRLRQQRAPLVVLDVDQGGRHAFFLPDAFILVSPK